MKYNLAVDGGGSKVAVIMYDNNYKLIGSFRTGSVRANTTPAEIIEAHVRELTDALASSGLTEIGDICGSFEAPIPEGLAKLFPVDSVNHLRELKLGLCAAFIPDDGVLILSGTGSGVYSQYNGKDDYSGGYGASIGDPGSGYDIGRRAFCAAIADYEGYGPKTVLRQLLCDYLGAEDLRQAVFSIYGPDIKKSPTASVASASPLVDTAARDGDAVAISILRDAGRSLGVQTVMHMKRNNLPDNIPVTCSGGVFKGNRIFHSSLVSEIRRAYPDFRLTDPEFEPVAGAVIYHYFTHGGNADTRSMEFFSNEYKQYKINTSHDGEDKNYVNGQISGSRG